LAHSFEVVGGVPGRVLFDNPKTVATGHLAGVAVLTPDLVRLAAHYRFSPRTTERQDPESKGKVEALVRFTKSDLIPMRGSSPSITPTRQPPGGAPRSTARSTTRPGLGPPSGWRSSGRVVVLRVVYDYPPAPERRRTQEQHYQLASAPG
jgi:transposase